MRIVSTYSITTFESAEEGEYEDEGYLDEEGAEFGSVEEAIEHLKNEGVTEASSSCFHVGVWYDTEENMDPYTGEHEKRSYHVKDATPEEERTIYFAVIEGKPLCGGFEPEM